MCIIAIKPRGVEVPSNTTFRNMWDNNPDGAGFMYTLDGKVHIDKGYMTFQGFTARLEHLEQTLDLYNLPMIFHFRIMTSGTANPQQTHPFPITNKLRELCRLHSTCNLGMVHNGVIRSKPTKPKMSDTMEYVLCRLHPLRKAEPGFLQDRRLLDLIQDQTNSKLAFLTNKGEIVTVGIFHTTPDGITYSNDSYQEMQDWYTEVPWNYKRKAHKNSKHLVWLDPEREYLIDEEGEYWDADDYLIDEDNNLYKYNYAREGDTAIPVTGMYVIPSQSRITRYEEEWAEAFGIER